jgi:hypothetical protein
MVQGFSKILTFFLLAYLHLFATSVSGQKVYKDNFTKIAKTYLEYATSNPYEKFTHHKLVLDTSTTVFIISTIPFAKDSFLFVIKFWRTDILTDLKYKSVYSLANYKLVIVGDEDKSRIISNLFKKRQYENLNKGKKVNGVSYEDFQKWTFLMNKNYEILQAISGFPQQSEFIELLKKSKVSFAKNFTLVPE